MAKKCQINLIRQVPLRITKILNCTVYLLKMVLSCWLQVAQCYLCGISTVTENNRFKMSLLPFHIAC